MRKLNVRVGDVSILIDVLNTPTGNALYSAAPFSSIANTWGEEVYFSTPVSLPQEATARDVMQEGEAAYWPAGEAIALCFGRTPVSQGNEMRLASAANVWGKTVGGFKALRHVRSGASVKVEIA